MSGMILDASVKIIPTLFLFVVRDRDIEKLFKGYGRVRNIVIKVKFLPILNHNP